MIDKEYKVRASYCDHRAGDDEIYAVLKRMTDPLDQSWAKLQKARKVVLKFNMIILQQIIIIMMIQKITPMSPIHMDQLQLMH